MASKREEQLNLEYLELSLAKIIADPKYLGTAHGMIVETYTRIIREIKEEMAGKAAPKKKKK